MSKCSLLRLSLLFCFFCSPNISPIKVAHCNPLTLDSDHPVNSDAAVTEVNLGVGYLCHLELGNRVSFFSDVFIAYRSPLAREPQESNYSASDIYQSNELFNFLASHEDLENEALDTVPVEASSTRLAQSLPWLQKGDRSGQLIYHAREYKVLGGVQDLPTTLLNWTNDVARDTYLAAPHFIPYAYPSNVTS